MEGASDDEEEDVAGVVVVDVGPEEMLWVIHCTPPAAEPKASPAAKKNGSTGGVGEEVDERRTGQTAEATIAIGPAEVADPLAEVVAVPLPVASRTSASC